MIQEILPNKIKLKKNAMPIKSPLLWYGSGFLFITKQMVDIIMHSLLNKCKTTHFLNGISSKNFKFLNYPRFNWCISISYIVKQFTQEFHPQP
jgi:hypothetical protein